MTTIQIHLPDPLAREAQQAGLLTAERLEQWLREQLAMAKTDALFAAMDRMQAVEPSAALSPEEVAAEIAAMRAARRARTLRP